MSMKNSNDTIGNRTRNLPANGKLCSSSLPSCNISICVLVNVNTYVINQQTCVCVYIYIGSPVCHVPTAVDYEGCRLVISIGEANRKAHAHRDQRTVIPRTLGPSVRVVTWHIEFKVMIYTIVLNENFRRNFEESSIENFLACVSFKNKNVQNIGEESCDDISVRQNYKVKETCTVRTET
jgi:hypothetical protein